ncbi:MAG: helix-turn-helix transcriptional regulator [Clostridia bacterium]
MVADTIRLLREKSGFTQSSLAKKLNITRSSVNAWEMGISVPSTQYIVELAQLFRVTTDYLLGVTATTTLNIDHLSIEETHIIYALLDYFKKKHD